MNTQTEDFAAQAVAFREEAKKERQAQEESFARSDTDGALSQWGHASLAEKAHMAARIADNQGKWRYDGLFDLSGNLIPAIRFYNAYDNPVWGILRDENENSGYSGYLNESKAENKETFIKNMAKKGYYVGSVLAPAVAENSGSKFSVSAYAKRTDGRFNPNVEITDNGQEELARMGLI